MERRPPELLDRLAIRAAYLHHSDRKSVKEVTAELQAAGEPVLKDDDIRMLIRRALSSGLVKIEVTRTFSTGIRRPDLLWPRVGSSGIPNKSNSRQ